MSETPSILPTIGWREWITLPALGIAAVKAKVDTGARSSAIHAFDLERFDQNDKPMLRFKVHPFQRDRHKTITTEAELLEDRQVRSSNGQTEHRPVIRTPIQLNGQEWLIELTLTNRDVMGFRMLLGRQAVRHRFLIDAGGSYLQSQPPPSILDNSQMVDDPNEE